jgi:hypothetical protein
MDDKKIQLYFEKLLENDDLSIGIAAIKTLLEIVKKTDCK